MPDDCYFDHETGLIDRRIFADEDIYREELRKIFGRAWNFMCHESQIPEPGDYFVNYIGADEVLAVRGRDGRIHVLLNTCPHRGNTVCRAELGNARRFVCAYHGWSFDLDGTLLGMPGEAAFYRGNIDKSAWGMSRAAQVDSYHGFVFATLDAAAPPLADYLGWVGRLGIDFIASQGDIEFLDGVQKNRVQCNWKIAVDNLHDWYHVRISHSSAIKVGILQEEPLAPMEQMVLLGEYGHGISGPGMAEEAFRTALARLDPNSPDASAERAWYDPVLKTRLSPDVQELLGPVGKRSLGHPNIFPNLWIASGQQLCLRIPRSATETELWWFTYRTRQMTEKQRRASLYMSNHFFGPGGFLEQDDGENWSHSTRTAAGDFARARPAHLAMGLGADTVTHDPSGQSRIDTVVNEHAQRWTYRNWQEWMRAESWQELAATHSAAPEGSV